jgi:adenylosuccinate synthase
VGYRSGGTVTPEPPLSVEGYAGIEPVYEELPGWSDSTVGVTRYDALPGNARAYLERLSALVNVPIDMISTGPDRDETIVLRHPFGA